PLADQLVLRRQRHLKWRALDPLEMILMVICGVTLLGFSLSVLLDIFTRTIGHPWLWLQEVTSTLFVYGIFIGAAAATRRNDHLYLTAFAEAMHGTRRLVVELTIRAIVLCVGLALVVLFTIEQIVNGCRNGFDHPVEDDEPSMPSGFGETSRGIDL